MGYYFVKSNRNLYRLTKRAYQTWIHDSANRVSRGQSPAKLKNYGVNVGEISSLHSISEMDAKDFARLDVLYSGEQDGAR